MKKTSMPVSMPGLLSLIAIMTIALFAANGYSTQSTLSLNVNTLNDSIYTTININGQLIVDSVPKQGARIGVTVDNKDGNHIYADELTTNTTGHYTTYFKLENTATGRYTVFASSSSTQAESIISTQSFTVGECSEDWQYSNWSVCGANSLQTRTSTDLNNCGTTENRSALSRSCEPACSALGGEICSVTQRCDGSYIDAPDTDRCCDGTCTSATTSTTTATNNNNQNTQPPATENTDDGADNDETGADTDANQAPADNVADNDDTLDDAPVSMTLNGTKSETDDSEKITDQTPTGRFLSLVSNNRWAIIDIILLVMIVFIGKKMMLKKEMAAPQKYSFKPKAGKPGLIKSLLNLSSIVPSLEFGYKRGDNDTDTGYGKMRPVRKLRVVLENDE
ncbi:MAG: hypothetical protein ABIG84_00325 [archaeon]